MAELSLNGIAFLTAWKTWDEACGRISLLAELEHSQGKHRRLSEFTLKADTDYFVDMMTCYAGELGVNPVHLMGTLNALRREGIGYGKAIQSVLGYLENNTLLP